MHGSCPIKQSLALNKIERALCLPAQPSIRQYMAHSQTRPPWLTASVSEASSGPNQVHRLSWRAQQPVWCPLPLDNRGRCSGGLRRCGRRRQLTGAMKKLAMVICLLRLNRHIAAAAFAGKKTFCSTRFPWPCNSQSQILAGTLAERWKLSGTAVFFH